MSEDMLHHIIRWNVNISGEASRIRRWRYAIVAERSRLCQAARRPGDRVG
jgi:hypothetical protein